MGESKAAPGGTEMNIVIAAVFSWIVMMLILLESSCIRDDIKDLREEIQKQREERHVEDR
jgi:hypothetical protein